MDVKTDSSVIEELLTRGVAEVIDREALRRRLLSGQKLRVKFGIDPTGPRLHLGRSIPLLKLRDFQQLGHQPVLVIGDITGQIGDTSDKNSERPLLSPEQVKENMAGYLEQIGRLLDLATVEVRYNSEWLEQLTLPTAARLADAFSVHEFSEREVIKRRLEQGKRVSLREMLYPLMQGYDSIAVKADVELGGTDQRFNLLAGRLLMRQAGLPAQELLLTWLVNGTDGEKMSTTRGNTIWLTEPPEELFGAVMNINDEQIIPYLLTATRVPLESVKKYEYVLQKGENPMTVKIVLARELVTLYHSAAAAVAAEKQFITTFSEGKTPAALRAVKVPAGQHELAELLVKTTLATSKSAARRLIEQGGVRVDETVVEDPRAVIGVRDGMVLNVGKRQWVRLTVR